MAFVVVSIKGTNIGVTTDATGHYFLKNLPIGDFILQASSVGYETAEHKIKTSPNKLLEVNFELKEKTELLEEVVISATRNETNNLSSINKTLIIG